MGIQAKALLGRLNAVCKAVDELAKAVERTFRTHPEAPIMLRRWPRSTRSSGRPWCRGRERAPCSRPQPLFVALTGNRCFSPPAAAPYVPHTPASLGMACGAARRLVLRSPGMSHGTDLSSWRRPPSRPYWYRPTVQAFRGAPADDAHRCGDPGPRPRGPPRRRTENRGARVASGRFCSSAARTSLPTSTSMSPGSGRSPRPPPFSRPVTSPPAPALPRMLPLPVWRTTGTRTHSFLAEPARGSALRAVEVPDVSGDTMWVAVSVSVGVVSR